jgi:cytochrome c oxidase subunit 2
MTLSRRDVGLLLGAVAVLLAAPGLLRLLAQEQAPRRREFLITARNYRYAPDRIEVVRDELLKLTIRSEDIAYSLTIDEYRVSRRIPAGGVTTLEFRVDRAGTYPFYSNLTNDPRHAEMRGELVVRER